MKYQYGLVFMIFLVISACNLGGQGEEVRPLFIGTNKVIDQTKADVAKQLVLSMDEVIEVKGINFEENIYVVAKVKQFDRFFLERIRKQAHDKVKKRFPEENVHVSTDKKVFLELEKLEIKINNNDIDKKTLKKEIKRIEEFMKG